MFQLKRFGVARWVAALGIVVSISACGGGGGSSSSTPATPPAPPPITAAPSSIAVTAAQGTGTTFDISLTLGSQVVTTTAHIFLKDPDDVVTSQFDLVSTDGSRSEVVRFHTTPMLSVGDHEGDLGFIVCDSSPCITPYSSTPANVHYKITITPPPPAATLTPASINLTVEQGDPASIVFNAVMNTSTTVQGAEIIDSSNKFSGTVDYELKSAGNYTFTLKLLPITGMPATYSGTFNLQLCNSINCSSQDNIPGSPVSIPYTITVTPFVPLAAIPTATGLPEWETFQGNAAHTGLVPVTLDSTTFTTKWSWTLPGSNDGYAHNISPVTTGSGKGILSVSGTNMSSGSLFALSESDGSVAWQHDLGPVFSAGDPAVFGGRTFLVTIGTSENTYLQAFSVSDGSPIFQSPITSQWAHYLAPTIKDGYLYTAGGSYGGLYAIKATSGIQKWFTNDSAQVDLWTPAVDGNFVYSHAPLLGTGSNFNGLSGFNLRDGSKTFSVRTSDVNLNGPSLGTAPVLPGDGSVLAVDGIHGFNVDTNHLVRYSVSQQVVLWDVEGHFVSNPVVNSGPIYVLNSIGNELEARDTNSGAVLWSWQPVGNGETTPAGNMILTNNLIFLSTSVATYAIDLTTHQAVWSTPHAGALALSSNEVLYISSQTDYTIYAYQLD